MYELSYPDLPFRILWNAVVEYLSSNTITLLFAIALLPSLPLKDLLMEVS